MQNVIDSHVHFWDPDHLRYPWIDEIEPLNRPHLPADLPQRGDGWSMEKLVFVQADCLAEQGLQEADWVASLAQGDPRIGGIVAFAPLENGDEARPILEKLGENALVKGVRRLIQSEPLGFSTASEFVRSVQSLKDYGFSFDICIKHPQMQDVITLVRQCPEIDFVLDHIGKPDIKAALLDPWREQIKTLAGFPNVNCKISGLVTEADLENWQPADLRPYIDHVLECFGIERVMYGSDWPVLRLAADYHGWIGTLLEATASLSEHESRLLFYENARSFYRL